MEEINSICESLKKSPLFLENLILNYSEVDLKTRRIENKWTAHEHACHVCVGEKFAFHKRVELFLNENNPIIKPISGDDFPDNYYYNMKINDCLNEFHKLRDKTVSLIVGREDNFWNLEGSHPEYFKYTPKIMIQHLLMHDYWHFYRIEELLLTRDEYIALA
jgi:hypothetical protein